jgi:hypothetical protein
MWKAGAKWDNKWGKQGAKWDNKQGAKGGIHFTDFHYSQKSSTALSDDLLHQVLNKLAKKRGNYG